MPRRLFSLVLGLCLLAGPVHATDDTFDTDAVAAQGTAFTNSNLTVQGSSTAGFRQVSIAQAREGKKSGKWCPSFTLTVAAGVSQAGISNSAGVGYDFLGGSNSANNWGYDTGGNIYTNGSSQTAVNNTSIGVGDRIDEAIDLDNSRLWFRRNGGSWIGVSGTPNPATNTTGFDISGSTANSLRVFAAVGMGASTTKWTADFSATACGGSPPSGFTAGWTNTTTGTYFGSLLSQADQGSFGPSGFPVGSTGPGVSKYVSTMSGALTSMVIGTFGGSGTYKCVVYDATGASSGPGALLATSTNTITASGSPSEASCSFSGLNLTSGTTYWPGVWSNSSATIHAALLTTGRYTGNTGNGGATPAPNPFVIAGGTTANVRNGYLFFVTVASGCTATLLGAGPC